LGALCAGLSQGASAITGYVTGLGGRVLAVLALVCFAVMIAVLPSAVELKKNLGSALQFP